MLSMRHAVPAALGLLLALPALAQTQEAELPPVVLTAQHVPPGAVGVGVASDYIPGAPKLVVAGGPVRDRGTGCHAGVRLRFFGPRPLTQSDQPASQATTIDNARAGYRFANGWRAQCDVFDLFDARSNQIDPCCASRLPGKALAGIELGTSPRRRRCRCG